jgi:hypothetical protein
MKLKDVKDRLTDAVETENPPGTTYYGAEVNEDEVEAARERIDETIRTHEKAAGSSQSDATPITRRQAS